MRSARGSGPARCRPRRHFFFFQAEDGIRDVAVTGVQTCALPISVGPAEAGVLEVVSARDGRLERVDYKEGRPAGGGGGGARPGPGREHPRGRPPPPPPPPERTTPEITPRHPSSARLCFLKKKKKDM